MYPVLKTGDLVVGEAVYLTGYHEGDIVVWYRTFSYGVIHEVISIDDGMIVTKGVNNPAPDPPIPSSYVKYKVVLHIPRSIWLPTLLLLAGVYAYYKRREIISAFKSSEPGALTIAGWMLAFFILLDMAVIFLSTVYYDSYRVSIQLPSVTLRSVKLMSDKPIIRIMYNINGTFITGVEECSITAGDALYHCGSISFTNNTIYVRVPPSSISHAFQKSGNVGTITVNLKVLFKGGNLTGRYSVLIPWRPIKVEASKGGIVVYNPNYLPVNITLRSQYYSYNNGVVVFLNETPPENITIPPHSNLTINIAKIGSFARVLVSYPYKPGSKNEILEVVKVDFT
jgi:hypothetical protein